jgi:hypothetical protein
MKRATEVRPEVEGLLGNLSARIASHVEVPRAGHSTREVDLTYTRALSLYGEAASLMDRAVVVGDVALAESMIRGAQDNLDEGDFATLTPT